MARLHIGIVLIAAAAFGMAAGQARAATGEDFRVENSVYAEDQKEPSAESTTIFYRGVVYDCMKSPAETVVFDKTTDRFELLNLTRRTRTEVTTAQLSAFVDEMRTVAAKNKDPVVRFLAEPKFDERFSDVTNELILSSPLVTYRVAVSPESDASVVEQYREFCDGYARLNALLVPGSLPPFGRLAVDAALAKRQATASRVVLTVTTGKIPNQQKMVIRSEHRVVRPLERVDLDRVAKAREMMEHFKLASFDDYRKLGPR
jgi:hypothetical protein